MRSTYDKLRDKRDYSYTPNPTLDLHEKKKDIKGAEEAVKVFLNQEKAKGVSLVKIVTGHGSGNMKRMVQEYLKSRPDIISFQDSFNVLEASILVNIKIVE